MEPEPNVTRGRSRIFLWGFGAELYEDPEPNFYEDPEPIYVRIRSRDINCINNNKFVIIVLGSLVELCTRDLLYLLIIITELIVGIRSRIVGSGYIFYIINNNNL